MPLPDSISTFAQVIIDGIQYDFTKYIVGPLIVTAAGSIILKRVFHKLQDRKEQVHFWIASFVALCTLFYFIGSTIQKPVLVGSIQTAQTGNAPNVHGTLAVISMSVINTGTMQSIVRNWKVEAKIGSNTYAATFPLIKVPVVFSDPRNKTGNPTVGIMYHPEDNILNKLEPVQPGGVLTGVIFAQFENLDKDVFMQGADITVTFEDVYSNKYAAAVKTTPEAKPVGIAPGAHTDLVCRAPPELLKQMQQQQGPSGPQTPASPQTQPKG